MEDTIHYASSLNPKLKVTGKNLLRNEWGDISATFHLDGEPSARVYVDQRKRPSWEPGDAEYMKTEINWYGTRGTIKDAEAMCFLLETAINYAKGIK